jgi:hypothetical protein
LNRTQQRLLERLWAGGSVRGQDPAIVVGLVLMGYVMNERLTAAGETLCAGALADVVNRMKKSVAANMPAR